MHQIVQPVSRKEFSQLIVTLYTLSIYISAHISWCERFSRDRLYLGLQGKYTLYGCGCWITKLWLDGIINNYTPFHKQLYSFFYQYFPTLFSGYTKLHNRPGRTRQHNRLQHANPATTFGGGLPSLGERLRPQLGAGLHTLRGCLPLLPGRLRTKLF